MISTLIFDLDGVVVDSFDLIVRSFQFVYKEEGFVVPSQFITPHIGAGAASNFHAFFKQNNLYLSDRKLAHLIKRFREVQPKFEKLVKVHDGFYDLTKEFKGSRIGLATMSSKSGTDVKLKRIKFKFNAITTADDVKRPKPYPDIFLKCAELLGSNPKECVVFEDAIYGVQAAKSAGMKCIGVTTGYFKEDELKRAGADLVIHSLTDSGSISSFIRSK